MPQSLTQIYLHIVFSTKNRRPDMAQPIQEQVHAYLAGACNGLDSLPIKVGGVEDHVHILCRLSKNIAVSELLRDLKRESSKWIKTTSPELNSFHWQNGYGAFSISPSHVDELCRYISNQSIHHQQESFQDEFRRLCRKYGLEIDERYVWD